MVINMLGFSFPELNRPQQVTNYLNFCKYKLESIRNRRIDLRKCNWIYPSTLLPLCTLLKENPETTYSPPENKSVANYIDLMANCNFSTTDKSSYIPLKNFQKIRKRVAKF